MTDLRALLQEARPKLAHIAQLEWSTQDLVDRIDAALAESAPEPVAECINVGDDIGTLAFVWADGFERKVGMKLYTAPPPANGEDAKGRIVTIGALLRSQLRDDIADRLAKLTAEQALKLADALIDLDFMVTIEDFEDLIEDNDLKC